MRVRQLPQRLRVRSVASRHNGGWGGGTDRAFLMPAWRSGRAALRTELSRTDRPSATLGVYTCLWLQFSLAQFTVIMCLSAAAIGSKTGLHSSASQAARR